MLNPREVLREYAEDVPTWLAAYTAKDGFPRDEFFGSRVVYYPGSGDDGHPLKVFGGAHAAHCFVFADYGFGGLTAAVVEAQLRDPCNPGHPKGYQPISITRLSEETIRPGGWRPHIVFRGRDSDLKSHQPEGGPYAIFAVLERRSDFGEENGAARLAIIFIGGEGVATYDALFCQGDARPPFGLLLQDHGFGGNWTEFGGKTSPLWRLASRYATPEWLLVGQGTDLWPGYEQVSDFDRGGMHGQLRWLYRLTARPRAHRLRGADTSTLIVLTDFR